MKDKKKYPKVLFISHTAEMGGAEYSLLDIVSNYPNAAVLLFSKGRLTKELNQLRIKNYYFKVLAKTFRIKREVDNFWLILQSLPEILVAVIKTARLARAYDLIYANSQKGFLIGAMAGKLINKPVIWHCRDILRPVHFTRTKIKLDVFLANFFATKVIANSHATAHAFTENGGRRDVVVIYNDFTREIKRGQTLDQSIKLRQELNLKKMPILGLFGRLTPWKGQHVALKALAYIPRVQLLLVGAPLFGNEKYEKKLQELCHKLQLNNRVYFLGHRRDSLELMRLCDVILHTSVAPEPFGRVIIEGMIAQKPVIAASGGAVKEIIADAKTGFIVKPNQPITLAHKIKWVLTHRDKAQAVSKNAYCFVKKEFSQEKTLKGIFDLIRTCAKT